MRTELGNTLKQYDTAVDFYAIVRRALASDDKTMRLSSNNRLFLSLMENERHAEIDDRKTNDRIRRFEYVARQ